MLTKAIWARNGLVFGRLACTSSKTEILNKINFNPDMSNKVFFHPKNLKNKNITAHNQLCVPQ